MLHPYYVLWRKNQTKRTADDPCEWEELVYVEAIGRYMWLADYSDKFKSDCRWAAWELDFKTPEGILGSVAAPFEIKKALQSMGHKTTLKLVVNNA